MAADQLIGLGLILLLGLPALIAASEQRRTPDPFHLLLALAALAWAWATGGLHAALQAFAAGVAVLLILTSGVAFTQRRWGRRLLTGSDVKLMSASALWLPPLFAVAAMVVALTAAVAWMSSRRLSNDNLTRPDLAPFVMTALLASFAFV